jgi:hypothetical protein
MSLNFAALAAGTFPPPTLRHPKDAYRSPGRPRFDGAAHAAISPNARPPRPHTGLRIPASPTPIQARSAALQRQLPTHQQAPQRSNRPKRPARPAPATHLHPVPALIASAWRGSRIPRPARLSDSADKLARPRGSQAQRWFARALTEDEGLTCPCKSARSRADADGCNPWSRLLLQHP